MANERIKEFAEGVIFKFPDDLANAEVDRVEPPNNPPATPTFTPYRHIMQVRLYDRDRPDEDLEDFGKDGFKMRVYYAESDLECVGGDYEKLRLAYHDGSDWTVFTKDKHGYQTKQKDQGLWKGYATVKIKTWKDPDMSWGP